MHTARFSRFLVAVLALACTLPAFGKDDKLTIQDVVAKHLESIGTPEARAAVKARGIMGTVEFNEIITGKLHMQGQAQMISKGNRIHRSIFQFGSPQYKGENIFVNEKGSVEIEQIEPGTRSRLGDFLYSQSEILKDGLWSGVMSTTWPFLDIKDRNPNLKYQGIKKVRDQEVHDVLYTPKKRGGNGDLIIHVYFDKDTFRHVMTAYTLTLHNQGGSIKEGTDETKYIVEERFSDFKTADGLVLPGQVDVRWRVEPSAKTQEYQYLLKVTMLQNNPEGLLKESAPAK